MRAGGPVGDAPGTGGEGAWVERAGERLPLRVKLGYGAGDLAGSLMTTITGFFLTAFLLDVVRLRPAAVAAVFLAAQLADAAVDPFIGLLADRTRTRWGRKRAWLLFGAAPLGVVYVLQWVVPPGGWAFAYVLVVSVLLRAAISATSIPHAALTPDLTPDDDERTQLQRYRFSFALGGSLVAVALHPVLVGLGGDDVARGHLVSALVVGLLMALAVLVEYRSTYERPDPPPAGARPRLSAELGVCLRNRSFLALTGVFLFSWLSLLLVQNNLLLYVRYAAGVEDAFTTILVVFQLSAIAFLGVWSVACRRAGRKPVYVAGIAVWSVALLALWWAPPGRPLPYHGVAFLVGAGAAVAYLIPWSMLPDVVAEDELRTGVRREGVYYGVFVLVQQAGLSLGLAGSNLALEAAGYVNPEVAGEVAAQPGSVATTLRALVSLVPLALLLLSLPFLRAYPITRARHAEIEAALADRPAAAPDRVGG